MFVLVVLEVVSQVGRPTFALCDVGCLQSPAQPGVLLFRRGRPRRWDYASPHSG